MLIENQNPYRGHNCPKASALYKCLRRTQPKNRKGLNAVLERHFYRHYIRYATPEQKKAITRAHMQKEITKAVHWLVRNKLIVTRVRIIRTIAGQ